MSADGIAVFLVGAVFLFFSLGLVLMGSSVYRQVVSDAQENSQLRTTLSYIANQVRRSDINGNVEIGKFCGQDALLLWQNLEGIECVTYLYCWEGSLRELFVEKGNELEPQAGLPLLTLNDIFFNLTEEGLICVDALFPDGSQGRLIIAPRCGVVGGNA